MPEKISVKFHKNCENTGSCHIIVESNASGIYPRSIYETSNLTPRLSCHFSIFGVVFFVFKFLLGIARQWRREKFAILTLKPPSRDFTISNVGYKKKLIIYICFARTKDEGSCNYFE